MKIMFSNKFAMPTEGQVRLVTEAQFVERRYILLGSMLFKMKPFVFYNVLHSTSVPLVTKMKFWVYSVRHVCTCVSCQERKESVYWEHGVKYLSSPLSSKFSGCKIKCWYESLWSSQIKAGARKRMRGMKNIMQINA